MLTYFFLFIALVAFGQMLFDFSMFIGELYCYQYTGLTVEMFDEIKIELIKSIEEQWAESKSYLYIGLGLAGLSYLNTLSFFEILDKIKMLL